MEPETKGHWTVGINKDTGQALLQLAVGQAIPAEGLARFAQVVSSLQTYLSVMGVSPFLMRTVLDELQDVKVVEL